MINFENEYWETLCPLADKEIHNLFKKISKKEITLGDLFKSIEKLPYIYEDCDLAKETINKVFDHLITLNYTEEEILKVYHKNVK